MLDLVPLSVKVFFERVKVTVQKWRKGSLVYTFCVYTNQVHESVYQLNKIKLIHFKKLFGNFKLKSLLIKTFTICRWDIETSFVPLK